MKKERRMEIKPATLIPLFAICLLGPVGTFAQQSSAPTAAPPARVHVDAPFAQHLIVKEKAIHPEIQKLGLHAVPPGQAQNVIIASNLPEKIGKVSAPSDLQIVAAGKPQAEKIDKEGYWDTFVPLHDRSGETIGFLVMEVPFSRAKTQDRAIDIGTSIRNEVQQQVPTLETLFEAAPQQ
jgi:hypothetical protein